MGMGVYKLNIIKIILMDILPPWCHIYSAHDWLCVMIVDRRLLPHQFSIDGIHVSRHGNCPAVISSQSVLKASNAVVSYDRNLFYRRHSEMQFLGDHRLDERDRLMCCCSAKIK